MKTETISSLWFLNFLLLTFLRSWLAWHSVFELIRPRIWTKHAYYAKLWVWKFSCGTNVKQSMPISKLLLSIDWQLLDQVWANICIYSDVWISFDWISNIGTWILNVIWLFKDSNITFCFCCAKLVLSLDALQPVQYNIARIRLCFENERFQQWS